MKNILLGLCCLATLSFAVVGGHAQCVAPTAADLAGYLKTHYQSPEEYVVSKFKDHDVVILGEYHKIKHDLELIHRLIPMVYVAGVYALATEFARAEDQLLIDSLLNRAEYDEALARRITFNQLPNWGFREYVDIFKVAWQLNHSLPEGAKRFRIIGMNCSPDFSVFQKPGDQEVDSLKRLARQGCGEEKWALIVRRSLENCPKIMVHCGLHHAFTRFLQPIVASDGTFIRFEDDRFGRHLYNWLGDRTFMIAEHSPWREFTYEGKVRHPAGGMFDSAAALMADTFQPFGMDVEGTPLECITDPTCIYANGHYPFRLGDFCDGYIMQKRFADFETVASIPDFVNSENLQQAQQQSPHPWFRNQPAEMFKTSMEQDLASLKERLSGL